LNVRSFWRTLDRRTLRDIGLVCLADAIAGASFGALATSGGLRPWVPVTMSVLVFAGGAQFAAAAVVLGGGSPVAAVIAGLLLNTRLLPYGFAVADAIDDSWPARLAGAHLITDETLAFALRPYGKNQRRAAFWICGVVLFTCWNVSVLIGALAGTALADPGALGLDAVLPTVLLVLVLPLLGDRRTRGAALTGAVIAVAAVPFLPAGLPVLLALAGLVLALPVPAGRETA